MYSGASLAGCCMLKRSALCDNIIDKPGRAPTGAFAEPSLAACTPARRDSRVSRRSRVHAVELELEKQCSQRLRHRTADVGRSAVASTSTGHAGSRTTHDARASAASLSLPKASAVARSEYKARIALCRHSITLRNAPSRYTAFTECTSFRSPLVELHTSKRLQPEAVITTERQESTGETRPDTGRQLNTNYNVTNTPTTPLQ